MKPDLKEIIELYGSMISTIAHRMIQNNEIAKEAAQEVWYEVLKSLNTFKEEAQLSTWIYSIAKRTILRYAKNEKRSTIIELEEFRALPEVDYTGSEENRKEWIKQKCDWCLTAVNHCLTNEARLIFIFKENVGLKYSQIAEIMDMQEDNVRQISARSINKITNFMNNTCPLFNPQGTCKCRIRKQVLKIDLEKEYTMIKRIIRLADLYQKFEKDLPRKNYWEKFLN